MYKRKIHGPWPVIVRMLILLVIQGRGAEGPSFPSNQHPSYSPDGKQIAFTSNAIGNFDIWIISADGSNLRRLTQGLGTKQKDPAWSPDGSRIAFASNKSGNFDIWVIGSDGNNPLQLTTGQSQNDQPAWSPNGTEMAFVSKRGGSKHIWMINSNGSNLRQLTMLAGQENNPSVSPGGDSVVFSETTESESNLMIVATNGSGTSFLTTGTFFDLTPTWTTQCILFSSDRNGSFSVWSIQPNGAGLHEIPNSLHGLEPVLSADGTLITFTTEQQDGSDNIVATNPVTGTQISVTNIKGFFVDILIKPGTSSPVPINASARGKIPVAILSTRTFDATTMVDRTSLSFGSTGDEKSLAFCDPGGVDVNGDGLPDLVCHFDVTTAGFKTTDSVAIVRGQRAGNERIESRANIRIVP